MKVIFLDRDGVINKFPGDGKYVTKVKDFCFLPGSLEAIRRLTEDDYIIFVISNQAGVGKGIFTKEKLDMITNKMLREIRKAGGRIKKVFYSIKRKEQGCEKRKPNIGSVKLAMRTMNKTLRATKESYFIGDTEADIKAGKNAGCKTIFVLSGRENRPYVRRWDDVRPDYIAKDLLAATKLILNNSFNRSPSPKKRTESKRAKTIRRKRSVRSSKPRS